MNISESTVYRILKREGLVKPAEVVEFKATGEYHRTAREEINHLPHDMPTALEGTPGQEKGIKGIIVPSRSRVLQLEVSVIFEAIRK